MGGIVVQKIPTDWGWSVIADCPECGWGGAWQVGLGGYDDIDEQINDRHAWYTDRWGHRKPAPCPNADYGDSALSWRDYQQWKKDLDQWIVSSLTHQSDSPSSELATS